MGAAGLVYVTVTVSGILFVSPQPVTMEQCTALQSINDTTLCIDKEPDCGKASGHEPCLGTADWEERVRKPARRRWR